MDIAILFVGVCIWCDTILSRATRGKEIITSMAKAATATKKTTKTTKKADDSAPESKQAKDTKSKTAPDKKAPKAKSKPSVEKSSQPVEKTAQTEEKTSQPTDKTQSEEKNTQPEKAARTEKKASEKKPSQTGPKKAKTPQTMEELLSASDYTLVVPQRGDSISGTITSISKKSMTIDIGAKTEGFVVDKEFALAKEYISNLTVGDTIEAQVVSSENDHGQVMLSLKQAAMDAKWSYFEQALENNEPLVVKGVDVNKGGLIVSINGVRGFVPSSQFGKAYIGKYHQLKGKDVKVKVIEVEREKNRLIFSERHVSEAEELAQREAALSSVAAGEIYEGVVSGVMPFGLFVTVEIPVAESKETLGHVEGLVHISEISWEKVNNPGDYHKVGDRLKVKVLGIDEDTGKLNLSIKQLSDDPWKGIDTQYPVGTTFTGTVSRKEQFGIFVNVEPGVDGLIHMSKLTPSDTYEVGDEVTVTVESVDSNQRRMSLSPVLTEVPMGYK